MTSRNVQKAVDMARPNMTGLVVAPWDPSEVYGVAAKSWGEPSATVYTYDDESGWQPSSWQVADFCHEPIRALAEELQVSLRASGEPEEEAIDLVDDATEF